MPRFHRMRAHRMRSQSMRAHRRRATFRRTQLILTLAAAGAATGMASMAACASGHNVTHLHEINVQVKNNLAVPTVLTIYAVSAQGNRLLGDVAPGDSTMLKWVPPSNGGSYRLIAERPSERPIRSQPFTVAGGTVGTMTWILVPNIIAFEEPNVIDTVHVDSAGVR